MKRVQQKPDRQAKLKNGSTIFPLCTLTDEYGGKSHIVVDDGCYVLANGNDRDNFGFSSHWYREAVIALRSLPDDPKEATTCRHRVGYESHE